MPVYIYFIIAAVLILIIWAVYERDSKKTDACRSAFIEAELTYKEQLKEEAAQIKKNKEAAYESERVKAFDDLELSYGKVSYYKSTVYNTADKLFSLSNYIIAFEDKQVLYFFGNTYNFTDIIGFQLLKEKNELYEPDYNCSDTGQYNYSILLNVNCISKPTDEVFLDWDGNLANDIANLLNVIVYRNKSV